MRLIILLFLLTGCGSPQFDNVINWHDMKEGPQKDACGKCARNADIKDCNYCAGH